MEYPFLFYSFITAGFIQIFYYLFFYARFALYEPSENSSNKSLPLSVIIAARNEEDNIVKNLPSILNQDHPDFEVIVVDDCSLDQTLPVLRAFEAKYPNLKIVSLKENKHFSGGKKFAVTLGIKAAKHEYLVFTDADCRPESTQWLSKMASGFDNNQIVLGYGAYEKQKGLLNKLVRFDTFMIALQYFSYALAGIPYMGVGRNLAYKKQLFIKEKGFSRHRQLASGDDDLFVNRAATGKNTTLVIDGARTLSRPESTWKDWVRQKSRHYSTSAHYTWHSKLLLAAFAVSQFIFILLFITLMALKYMVYLIMGVVVFRYLIQFFIFRKSLRKLGEEDLLFLTPIFEVILNCIYPIFALSMLIRKEVKWKM